MIENGISASKEVIDLILTNLEQEGKTAILVVIDDGNLSWIIAMADTVKQSTKEAISTLKQMDIEVVMLTGDNESTANAIASKIGIERV